MTLRITGRVIAISGPARKATVRLSANGRPLASKDVALGDGFTLTGAINPRVMTRENQVVVETDAILDSSSAFSRSAFAVLRFIYGPMNRIEPGVLGLLRSASNSVWLKKAKSPKYSFWVNGSYL